jgi:DNA polymerase-3 subunit alpha
MFGYSGEAHIELQNVEEWSMTERLQGEKETLGFYLSGHPLQIYESEFKQIISQKTIAGIVTQIKTMFTKRGDRMAFVTVDTRDRMLDMTIFSELFEENKAILAKDNIIIVEGELSEDNFTGGEKLLAKNLYSLDVFRAKFSKALLLDFNQEMITEKEIEKLTNLLYPFKSGRCPVLIQYSHDKIKSQFQLGDEWKIHIREDLLKKLWEVFGQEKVRVCY